MSDELAEKSVAGPPADSAAGKVGEKERYAAAVALIGASEATSVSRFNAFLVFSAILAAGWVQLATRSDALGGKVTMTLFCLIGAVAGVVWAGIGGRSRSYVELYRKIGQSLEENGEVPSTAENSPCKGAAAFRSVAANKYRHAMERGAGASRLFFAVPLAVGAMFLLLLVPTWWLPVLGPPPPTTASGQPVPSQAADRQPQRGADPTKP